MLMMNQPLKLDYQMISSDITLQTAAAFERINEALVGRTQDDFYVLIKQLDDLLVKAKRIEAISNEMNH